MTTAPARSVELPTTWHQRHDIYYTPSPSSQCSPTSLYDRRFLVHGQVAIIFVVSVGLSVCLFVCLCRVSLSRL